MIRLPYGEGPPPPRWKRSIAQPTIVLQGSTFPAMTWDHLGDGGDGAVAILALTKIINGARLTSVRIRAAWRSAHSSPASPALLEYLHILPRGGSIVVASTTCDPSMGTSALFTLEVPGCEVIDDAHYRYALRITAEAGDGAQAFDWCGPILDFDDIVTTAASAT